MESEDGTGGRRPLLGDVDCHPPIPFEFHRKSGAVAFRFFWYYYAYNIIIGEIFTEIDEEARLMQWAGRVLSRQDSDFQHRFVKMLMALTSEQWLLLEEKINELASNPDNLRKDDDSADVKTSDD